MLLISDRIESFINLGDWLRADLEQIRSGKNTPLLKVIDRAGQENGWFTQDSVMSSLASIAEWMTDQTLNRWSKDYYLSEPTHMKTVAVIMAGNIPLVNFHDFLSVLITGHRILGKLSSQDKVLLPFLAQKLIEFNPEWKARIDLTEERLGDFDAVIATGSDNSARYFEYYFGKYPHIIRKNRHSLAILTGKENPTEMKLLYSDIFQYYGLGCRNVSMLLVPEGYSMPALFDQWEGLADPTLHHKYKNNYDYYRSIYLVNSQPFYDTGYVSVKKSEDLASPLSVLHYLEYADIEYVNNFVKANQSHIQCIVTTLVNTEYPTLRPGNSQCPTITDYPDGVDIIQFLLAL